MTRKRCSGQFCAKGPAIEETSKSKTPTSGSVLRGDDYQLKLHRWVCRSAKWAEHFDTNSASVPSHGEKIVTSRACHYRSCHRSTRRASVHIDHVEAVGKQRCTVMQEALHLCFALDVVVRYAVVDVESCGGLGMTKEWRST